MLGWELCEWALLEEEPVGCSSSEVDCEEKEDEGLHNFFLGGVEVLRGSVRRQMMVMGFCIYRGGKDLS